jgi:hypothetical protein
VLLLALVIAALPPCEAPALEAFDRAAIQASSKNSEAYVAFDGATVEAIADALSIALDEGADRVEALERASVAGYAMCREDDLILFRPYTPGFGQPVFVIREGDARKVIVEVPHTVFDYYTLEQGVAAFRELGARALLVSGSHRCASSKVSSCDGASDVCGGSGPFRESDAAHATETIFQRAHELLADRFRDDVVLSLHGMDAKQGAILSDGTTIETSSTAVVSRLAGELGELYPEHPITVCSGLAGPMSEELCGTTNVQGRHLNGSEDACREGATRSSGRFLHLEQSTRLRREPAPLIEALRRVIPATDFTP